MSDENPLVRVHYLELELSNGRKVNVGFNEDDKTDQSYWFKFVNSEDQITQIRLSSEAFAAIIRLKDYVDVFRDTGTVMEWKEIQALSDDLATQ